VKLCKAFFIVSSPVSSSFLENPKPLDVYENVQSELLSVIAERLEMNEEMSVKLLKKLGSNGKCCNELVSSIIQK
jgi:hypothetical protein